MQGTTETVSRRMHGVVIKHQHPASKPASAARPSFAKRFGGRGSIGLRLHSERAVEAENQIPRIKEY